MTSQQMAQAGGHAHGSAHRHHHARPSLGPLARGVGFRLVWAAGLSALLWLLVLWALT